MGKRLAGLVLCTLLFAGCADLALTPSLPVKTGQPGEEAEAPAEKTLAVYDPEQKLAPALESYHNCRGIEITAAESAQTADLAVFYEKPGEGTAKDISQSAGLVHTLAAESPCYGFSMGGSNYGFVVNEPLLKSLLGDAPWVDKMDANEWDGFVTALDEWIDDPNGQNFHVGNKTYYLPKEKEGDAANLKAVFAVEKERRYVGPVLTPVLATCYKSGADFLAAEDKKELKGALNSLFTLLGQEIMSLSKTPAPQAFAGGEALFCRTTLAAAQAADKSKTALVLPLPFSFDESDLHGGLALREILGQTVALPGGWLAIPAGADEEGTAQAEGFLVWLYASEEGRKLPKDKGEAAPGMEDISQCISSEGMSALQKLCEEQPTWNREGRKAFTGGVLDVLQKEGAK